MMKMMYKELSIFQDKRSGGRVERVRRTFVAQKDSFWKMLENTGLV